MSKNCEHVVCGPVPIHLENDDDPDLVLHARKVFVDELLADTTGSAEP